MIADPRILPTALLVAWTNACAPALELSPSDAGTVLSRQGAARTRTAPEYRDSVAIETQPVDASKLVDLGTTAKERNGYWGLHAAERHRAGAGGELEDPGQARARLSAKRGRGEEDRQNRCPSHDDHHGLVSAGRGPRPDDTRDR
jgi:hypothetical protein